MDQATLKKLFPNISADCLAENTHSATMSQKKHKKRSTGILVQKKDDLGVYYIPDPERFLPEPSFSTNNSQNTLQIVISDRIRGGKNSIGITRTGKRYPKKDWAKWRDQKVAEVVAQLPANWTPIDRHVDVSLKYVAETLRRHDQPAIIDSIFHILEKAGVVTDDVHLWVASSSRSYDKHSPRAVLTIPLE